MRTDPVEAARFYLEGLASLHLRRRVSEDDVAEVLQQSPPIEYGAGQSIFRQGEPADAALLVVHGELAVFVATDEGERRVGTVGPWDVVGETALYAPDHPRSASVRAGRDSTCLVITHDMLKNGRDNGVVAALEYHLLHTMSHRIRVTNEAIHDAWRELEADSAALERATQANA
jgi:CRP-like cAMP-binding protein